MANVIQYNYVSRDAQTQLEEFRADFNAAFMTDPAEQWASNLGLAIETRALKVTLPIPLSAAGYVERFGDRIYRRLSETSFSFTPRIWQDGFAEFIEIVEAPDFIGFQQEPANMASAASQLMNELVTAQLEANPTGFDGVDFFSGSHPYNVLDASIGTYDNDVTGAGTNLTAANIGLARKGFREIKGPNGKPLGVRLLGILVPPALEETMRQIAEARVIVQSSTVGAVDNIYVGTKYWVSDQLDSDTEWYAIGQKRGMYPWATVSRGAPETMVLGRDSALFERENKVGFHSTLQAEAALAFPQLVQRWAGTAPA